MSAAPFVIIADDATGALDAAMQLLPRAGRIRYVDGIPPSLPRDVDVLSVNLDTRNVSASRAQEASIAAARVVPIGYKKIDSTLRGNIGPELRALLGTGRWDRCLICPALPEAGRTTVDGLHYVHGVPLGESEFATDPFAPVCGSDVRKIVGADLPLIVPDVRTRADLQAIAQEYVHQPRTLLCGSAGLLGSLTIELNGRAPRRPLPVGVPTPQLVISGSPASASKRQIAHLAAHNPRARTLRPELALIDSDDWVMEHRRLVDSAVSLLRRGYHVAADLSGESKGALHGQDAARLLAHSERILALAGDLCRAVRDGVPIRALHLLGGDTLRRCMRALGMTSLNVVEEGLPLIPVCAFADEGAPDFLVITKAGGFGADDALTALVERLEAHE